MVVAFRGRCVGLLRWNGTALACILSVVFVEGLARVVRPAGGRRTALPRSHGAWPWSATLAALVDGLTYVLGAAEGCHSALLNSNGTTVACCRLASPVEDRSHAWEPPKSAARPWSTATAPP